MATTLLPPSATDLMNVLAQVDAERMEAIENKIATLWNPWACPAPFLPWLAWAFSVDVWDSSWPESRKRAVIAASFTVHRYKGTRKALAAALKALDVDVDITEWWETTPEGEPYTFSIKAELATRGLSADEWGNLLASIDNAKNVRSHLTELAVWLTNRSPVPKIAMATMAGEEITTYPRLVTEIEAADAVPVIALAHYGSETATVRPVIATEIEPAHTACAFGLAHYGVETMTLYPN